MTVKTYEEVLAEKGVLCWRTVGVSMKPFICEGRDIVVIERLRKPLEKYDVVLFRRPSVSGRGAFVLHRILKINPDGTFWIVGDNCRNGETVQAENILGVLTSVVRKGKEISLDSLRYRLYVYLWCGSYPVRSLVLRCMDYIRRAIKKLIKSGIR